MFFEKLVYNQLHQYLDRHKFLYKHQSGFRSIHSVLTCLLPNTNEWYLNLDDKRYTGMVFIELKKALDTVDNTILARSLYLYGVRNTESKWFQSYLVDRQQLCNDNGISSDLQDISFYAYKLHYMHTNNTKTIPWGAKDYDYPIACT